MTQPGSPELISTMSYQAKIANLEQRLMVIEQRLHIDPAKAKAWAERIEPEWNQFWSAFDALTKKVFG